MDPTESMIDDTTHLPPYRPTNNNSSTATATATNNSTTAPYPHRSGIGAPNMEPILSEDEPSQYHNYQHNPSQQSTTSQRRASNSDASVIHTPVAVDTEADCHHHHHQQRYSNEVHGQSQFTPIPSSGGVPRHSEEPRQGTYHDVDLATGKSSISSRNPHWQLSLDFSEKAAAHVKREDSSDSMWLHQSPKSVVPALQ
jgi:hypothetical protein